MDDQSKEPNNDQTKWTRHQVLTLLNFYIANFCVGVYYGMLFPFFPIEAAKKGMSSVETGLVFSVFEMVIILFSPVFGAYIGKCGGKPLYIIGLIVAAISSLSFGLLEYCPPGNLFITLSLIIRVIEAVGATAYHIASYAMLATTFPDRLAIVIGYFELCVGLGLMIGPPYGGLLFKIGGFKMPFLVTASLNVVIAIISIFHLTNEECVKKSDKGKTLTMLKQPVVLLMMATITAAFCCLTFNSVGLAQRINRMYHYGPAIIGCIFLVGPGLYSLSCPIWGCLAGRLPKYSIILLICGNLATSIGFLFMGPAPFLHIRNDMLWLLLISLATMGIGLGTLVNSFPVMTTAAIKAGLAEDLDTFGVISGLFNTALSMGALTGPLLGGYLIDTVDYEWATFIFGCLPLTCAIAAILYKAVDSTCLDNSTQQDHHTINEVQDERTALVSKKTKVEQSVDIWKSDPE